MIYLYYTKREVKSQSLIKKILFEKMGFTADLLKKNENGKPYLIGDPIYFNATNTRDFSAIAVTKSPIGLDAEPLGRKPLDELTAFVAKEAYVKRLGESIFAKYKILSFSKGKLYENNDEKDTPTIFTLDGVLIAVSCEDKEIQTINLDKENLTI